MLLFNLIPLPYRILGVLLICVGLFYGGYRKGLDSSNTIITKYKLELATKSIQAQQKVAKSNDVVVTEYVDKVKVITKKEFVYVDTAKNVVPSRGELPIGWVRLHDDSATNADVSDTSRYSDATPSGIKDNTALATITENYSICTQNAEQVKALQEWVNVTKVTIEGKK
jgi:hypothetical protein